MWRGLAIILVVSGHAISQVGLLTDHDYVFRLVYSFHVALFFFISGVVAAHGIGRPLLRQFRRKMLTLVVPFLSWYVLVSLIGWLTGGAPDLLTAAWNLVRAPGDYGLWFLWVLFMATMLAAVITRCLGTRWAWVGLALVAVALLKVGDGLLGLPLLAYYFPLFVAGLLCAPRFTEGAILDRAVGWKDLIAPVAFAGLLLGWCWSTQPVQVARLWNDAGLPGSYWVDLLYRYATAAAGIGTSIALVRTVRGTRLRSALSYLGRNTLEIYVSHNLILAPFAGAGIVWVPLAAVVAGAGSLLLAALLERVPALGLLLYGGRKREPAQ